MLGIPPAPSFSPAHSSPEPPLSAAPTAPLSSQPVPSDMLFCLLSCPVLRFLFSQLLTDVVGLLLLSQKRCTSMEKDEKRPKKAVTTALRLSPDPIWVPMAFSQALTVTLFPLTSVSSPFSLSLGCSAEQWASWAPLSNAYPPTSDWTTEWGGHTDMIDQYGTNQEVLAPPALGNRGETARLGPNSCPQPSAPPPGNDTTGRSRRLPGCPGWRGERGR